MRDPGIVFQPIVRLGSYFLTTGEKPTVPGTAALPRRKRKPQIPDIPILSDDDLKEAEDGGKKRDK
jgi:hypothetical protein